MDEKKLRELLVALAIEVRDLKIETNSDNGDRWFDKFIRLMDDRY